MCSPSKRYEFYKVVRLFYEKYRQGSPTIYYFMFTICFFSYGSKHSPLHLVLKCPRRVSPQRHNFTLIWKKGKIMLMNSPRYFVLYRVKEGARGSAFACNTALQRGNWRIRFPLVSLEFFIDIILLATLWPWGWL